LARAWVEEMRRRHIFTLVTINANECAVQRQPAAWYEAQIEAIIAAVGYGNPYVILMPLSEPGELGDRRKAREWTEFARRRWIGPFAVDQRDLDIPHDYVDVHWCDMDDLTASLRAGPPNRINSTDCPGMFELGPDRAREATDAAVAGGTILYVYADKFTGDHGAIMEAMRP
jgi:hypothetical protein